MQLGSQNIKIDATYLISMMPYYREHTIDALDMPRYIGAYGETKDMSVRNMILRILYHSDLTILADFFLQAYKKERYIDMKFLAIRGLCHFETEVQISEKVHQCQSLLQKQAEKTPYNYHTYELLRGKHLLPYLLDTYNYRCFREMSETVEQLYDAMPEEYTGVFSVDIYGEVIQQ